MSMLGISSWGRYLWCIVFVHCAISQGSCYIHTIPTSPSTIEKKRQITRWHNWNRWCIVHATDNNNNNNNNNNNKRHVTYLPTRLLNLSAHSSLAWKQAKPLKKWLTGIVGWMGGVFAPGSHRQTWFILPAWLLTCLQQPCHALPCLASPQGSKARQWASLQVWSLSVCGRSRWSGCESG